MIVCLNDREPANRMAKLQLLREGLVVLVDVTPPGWAYYHELAPAMAQAVFDGCKMAKTYAVGIEGVVIHRRVAKDETLETIEAERLSIGNKIHDMVHAHRSERDAQFDLVAAQ
jgi:hypothetical protein